MARRKELKDVASGLYGAFISRNNDVGGYWGIGKLCLLAQECDTGTVSIDLLAKTIAPESGEFIKLLSRYHSFLHQHLVSRGIPSGRVIAANIELNFNPEDPPEVHVPIATRGNLFKLSVALRDDKMKLHIVCGFSYCAPHNPKREHQSGGKERF